MDPLGATSLDFPKTLRSTNDQPLVHMWAAAQWLPTSHLGYRSIAVSPQEGTAEKITRMKFLKVIVGQKLSKFLSQKEARKHGF